MVVASREEAIVEQQAGRAGDGEGEGQNEESTRNIIFFDVETNVPGRMCRGYELLEFGAVALDARGLGELGSFHTLIRPKDLSCIDRRTSDCNTITPATVADAPTFADVANHIFRVLHGHIWAGHNILKFDILRVNEAFLKIGQQPPQPFGVIDTYPLLRKTFGKRAGNYKLATLANYCGYGKQEHRSLADVRMNIDVLRSCAAVLFLESNYPDFFTVQNEVIASTSISEQSALLSTPSRCSTDDNAEQEVDSQVGLSDEISDPSSRSPISFEINPNLELSELTDSLKRSRLSLELEELKASVLGSVREKFTHNTFSRDVREGEECISSECMKVSSSVSKTKHIQQESLTGYEQINEKISVAEVVDRKSSKGVDYEEVQLCNPSVQNTPALDISKNIDNGEDILEASLSLWLKEDAKEREASASSITNGNLFLAAAQHSYPDSREEFEGVPFLLASSVSLPSIEVCTEPSSFPCSKILLYNGFPLHLLELKIKVRFTINLSYAFDERGKPRFSILLEPSESACNVIHKCEDVVKSMSVCDGEVEWLPALKKDSGCWVARMSIGTKWGESFSTYTTEFFRCNSNGLEKLSLGHVDALTFRNMIPHGCSIDVGFGFYVFNVNNRTGVKLIAKHITLT